MQISAPGRDDEVRRARHAYFAAGIAWQVCVRAYWLLFFVRVTIDLDFSPLELVLLGTAKEVAVLTMEVPTGIVADVYSRKWSVVIGFVVTGAAVVGAGLLDSFGLLMASSALWGLGLTFRSGAEVAWLTGEVGSTADAERIVLQRSSIEMIAVVGGVVAATVLSVATSNGTALAVFGAGLLVTGGVLAVAMPERGFVPLSGPRRVALATIVKDGVRAARRVRPLRILVTATVFAGFASEAVDRLYVRRLDDIGLADWFADEVIVVAAVVVSQALVAWVALRVARRTISARRQHEVLAVVLTALLAATAVGVALLALVDVLVAAGAGLVLAGAMRAATEPVKAAWANEHAPPASRATVQSFVGQAHSFGEIVGGVTLGLVATLVGVPAALTISALTYGLAATTIARFRRRSR